MGLGKKRQHFLRDGPFFLVGPLDLGNWTRNSQPRSCEGWNYWFWLRLGNQLEIMIFSESSQLQSKLFVWGKLSCKTVVRRWNHWKKHGVKATSFSLNRVVSTKHCTAYRGSCNLVRDKGAVRENLISNHSPMSSCRGSRNLLKSWKLFSLFGL